jgi:hypothetical protein
MADQPEKRDLSLIWITAGLLVVSAIIVYAMSSVFA